MASMGWDSLVVDMQHGMIDYQMMVTMLQGISTTNVTPLVRVPWNDPATSERRSTPAPRDRLPDDHNRAEAEKFVGSCRYAPLGYRSSGADPCATSYGGRIPRQGQRHRCGARISETQEALDNLDAILSTSGSRRDLCRPSTYRSPSPTLRRRQARRMDDGGAEKRLLDGCKRHKVQPRNTAVHPAYAKKMIEMGFTSSRSAATNRFMTWAARRPSPR